VFWIHASNADRIEQGYREIAERVKIPGRNDLKQNIFELVARWLRDESKGTWVLVLDNLDNDDVLSIPQAATLGAQFGDRDDQLRRSLSAYLPQSQNGAILITTRTRSMVTTLVEPRDVIIVDPMTDIDAITLLKKKLDTPVDDGDLRELAYILEYMPLAIVQAAVYIRQRGARYSVQQYIKAFQQNEKKKTSLLNYEAGHLQRDPKAKNSIIITWQISFDDIREKWPLSADLLSLMCYFDRQGIPQEVLRVQPQQEEIQNLLRLDDDDVGDNENNEGQDIEDDGTSETSNDGRFEEAVDQLLSYSFISLEKDKTFFEMHGLVQLATRKWLAMHKENEKWKAQFSRNLNAVLPNGNYENWGRCEMFFPHAKSAERHQPTDDRSGQEWAQILRKAAWYAEARGDYREAERMCDKSVKALRKILGGEDVETSYSLGILASTYWNQGRWKEAEELQVQVMETRKRVLGQEHPHTLSSMASLALTYRNQGRWKEAEELQVQVMETTKRVLGQEHPDTLSSMASLAWTYRNQGRWKEAEELQVQVMETRKRVLGQEHPDTLSSMNNLASTYRDQGRWKEAEELGVQVMETTQKVLGQEHPHTLTSMNNLASTYWDQGRWKEAKELQVQVIETRKRVLGQEHPHTLSSTASLASTYWNQGRWKEAEELSVHVMETTKRVLGQEHPHTLSSMANLASTYRSQGRWKEAEELEVQVMETMKRVLGQEHPHTLSSMNNLASTYQDQGRWKEAEELQVQVMETRKRVLGQKHPDTLTSMNNLASTYWNQGRWKEAEELFMQVTETTKRVLGQEHPHTLSSMASLASTYRNQGRWKEAEELQVQVMETRKRVLGQEHPDTLSSMASLASTYRR
jgi:tetratricopeptide (TPR) repeat protein